MEENLIEEISEEEESFSDDALFNITSFGTDLSFRELIMMYDEGDLEKPELQRHYVWDKKEASRFIDSILLGLPVPSIFLAKTNDDKRLIVDGYQRIMTIYDYVKRGFFGGDKEVFALAKSEIINSRWRGKTFKELSEAEQRKIKNTPIHAIVFEQKEPMDDTGMYQIFERINTSGRSLKPQEIRNCVNHGSFNKLLMELNQDIRWRMLYNPKDKEKRVDSRMADVELILRLFAFGYFSKMPESKIKQINLCQYLNNFMKQNREFTIVSEKTLRDDFDFLLDFLGENLYNDIFRNGKEESGVFKFTTKINPAIFDAICSAVLFCYRNNFITKSMNNGFKEKYINLLKDKDFQNSTSQHTTSVENIKKRITIATKVLFGVEYDWR